MSEQERQQTDRAASAVTGLAEHAERKPRPLVRELAGFLWDTKAWWLAPIVFALLLVAGLIFLGGTAAAPFIYTLF